jgi:putative redox protein
MTTPIVKWIAGKQFIGIDSPWTFRKIHLHYKIDGKNLTEKAVAQTIQLSEEKYCSVAATVRATAQITTDFEIMTPEAAQV